MPLITCPDCRKEISPQAKSCLHCGRPMRYWTLGRVVIALILGIIIFSIAVQIPLWLSNE